MLRIYLHITLFAVFLICLPSIAFSQCNCPSGVNLLTNGGFQDPNTVTSAPTFIGFQSDYSATAPIGNYGIFRWTNDASSLISIWCGPASPNYYLIFDATTGADAAVPPYDAVRYVNIPVTPGTAYKLVFYSNNQYAPGPFAALTVKINGVLIDSFVENNTCTWTPHSYCWVANANVATIAINAGVGTLSGRDFGIDSVFFGTASAVNTSLTATICPGASYYFNGQTLTAPGTYTDTIPTAAGCDSIVTVALFQANVVTDTAFISICHGGSYNFAGTIVSANGTYIDTFSSSSGCDSIVALYLTQLPQDSNFLSVTICNGGIYNFGGNVLNSPGVYTDSFTNSRGCDSIVILTLNYNVADTTDTAFSFCNDTTISFAGQTITNSGVYIHVFQSSAGCDSVVRLSVTKLSSPLASFSYTPTIPEFNVPITFNNTSNNAIRYVWDFGDGTQSAEIDPNHLFSESGSFDVCLTAFTAEGCSDKICKTIAAEVLFVADVPSAFSPNGDNNNDILYVKGSGVKDLSFRIYNRWGNIVFETNDMSRGWDGTYKGKPQGTETYAWVLDVTFLNGKNYNHTGNLSLIR
jgi:gliding motility-associated-like protein